MVGGFFPMNFIEEVELESLIKEEADDDHLLGTLEKSFLYVHNLRPEPRPSHPLHRYMFRITDDSTANYIDLAAETEYEMNLWIEKVREAARLSTERYV